MPAATVAHPVRPDRSEIESLLRLRKLDHTFVDRPASSVQRPDDRSWPIDDGRSVPTGIADLDARLQGGIPRGHLSEVTGPRSSGRLAILVSALAGATARGETVALVDPLDMFDPVSASAAGIDFQRMLWVRGEATSSARVSLSCEYGTLQKALDRAIKSLNLILQAGSQAGQSGRGGRGRWVRAGGAGSHRSGAASHPAAALHHMAAAASRDRRQRHRVRADGQRADRAQQRGRQRAVEQTHSREAPVHRSRGSVESDGGRPKCLRVFIFRRLLTRYPSGVRGEG